jgi:hypothetical protein
MKVVKFICLTGLIISALSAGAFGQVTGGAITGSVSDTNAAALPNVKVKLTDKVRGNSMTVQTTAGGSYTFPNVPVGDYANHRGSFEFRYRDERLASRPESNYNS